jgi:hypothetical protein
MRRLAPPIICLLVFFAAYTHPGHTQNRRNTTQRAKPKPTPKVDDDDDFWASIPDATPTPTPTPEWDLILAQSGATFAYNTRRVIHPAPDTVRVWLRKRLLGKTRDEYIQAMGEIDFDYSGYAYTVSQEDYDCKGFRQRDLYVIDYDRSGKSIHSANYEADGSSKWRAVVPGSVAEYILNVVCRHKE